MIEWIPVAGSTRVVAIAYDAEQEIIYVRFPNGKDWRYEGCPKQVWEEFSAPSTSKGTFIHQVLNHRPNGPSV